MALYSMLVTNSSKEDAEVIEALSTARAYVMKVVYAAIFLLVAAVCVISIAAAVWYSILAALCGMVGVALGVLAIWLYKRIFNVSEPVEPDTSH